MGGGGITLCCCEPIRLGLSLNVPSVLGQKRKLKKKGNGWYPHYGTCLLSKNATFILKIIKWAM